MGMVQQLLTGRTRLPGFTEEWGSVRLETALELEAGVSVNSVVGPRSARRAQDFMRFQRDLLSVRAKNHCTK